MSQWGLEDEDEYDFDFDAAPEGGSGIGEVTEQPAAVQTEDTAAWDRDDAVSHPTGALHLWFEDRQVRHARVSNRWRERIKDQTFAEVLSDTLLRGQPPMAGDGPMIPDLGEPFPRRALGDVLPSFLERTLDLDDATRRLGERPDDEVTHTSHEGTEVEGVSRNRAVTVVLSIHGTTKDLTVDDAWLEKAQAAEIGAAIVEAHADAYARHTPPTVVLGEHARLAQERRQLATEILAAMGP